MGDVHAGDAPGGLLDHTDSWGTLGMHVDRRRSKGHVPRARSQVTKCTKSRMELETTTVPRQP